MIALYATMNGRQVPVFRYWPIPEDVLASKLKSKAKLLLGFMCRRAGRTSRTGLLKGHSLRVMASEIGMGEKAVRTHMKSLIAAGLVVVIRTPSYEQPDSYQLQLQHEWMQGPVVHIPEGLDLSPAALLIYGWIAWKQGNGYAWRWSVRQIGDAVGLVGRHVHQSRAELEKAGFIMCDREPGRSSAFHLVNNPRLSSVLIEGRSVHIRGHCEPIAAHCEPIAAHCEPIAGGSEAIARLKDSSTESSSESSKESFPSRGGLSYSTHPSGANQTRGRKRGYREPKDNREFDPVAAKDFPKIGW